MKRKRRHLTPEFKARVAIEALQGLKTINEIAQANELAPTQVSQWKKALEGRVPEIFAGDLTPGSGQLETRVVRHL